MRRLNGLWLSPAQRRDESVLEGPRSGNGNRLDRKSGPALELGG